MQTYLLLRSDPLLLPQLPLPVRFLLPQIRVLLHLRLVQPIDDRILPLFHVTPPHHLVILEPYLPRRHVAGLLQVAPRRIDDRHIVFLVALDTVGLGELGAVRKQRLRDVVPCLVLIGAEAEVDVRATEVVDVEPDVFWPAVGYEILISVGVRGQ